MGFMSSRGLIFLAAVVVVVTTCVTDALTGGQELAVRMLALFYTLYYVNWAQNACIKENPMYMVDLALKVEEAQKKCADKVAAKINKQKE